MTDNKVIDSMIEMFSEDAKWNLAIAGSGAALKRHPCLEEELKSNWVADKITHDMLYYFT